MNTNRQHIPSQQQQLTTEQIQKQREYLKQQQKLRLMAASSSQKIVTADTLIENLLGKKDTFKPLDNSASAYQPGGVSGATIVSQPPGDPQQPSTVEWLSPDAASFPSVYRQVWSLVGQPNGMVDTKKIFPLLLTSGLHTDVLGYIWGLANQRVAGQLTEQELYVLLALVALAQKGYSFNSASVLSLVPQPPLPNLSLPVETPHTNGMQREDLSHPSHPASATTVIPPRVETKPITPVTPAQLLSLQPSLMQSFSSHPVVQHNDFDDFTDFQSASSNVPDTSLKHTATEINNAAEYKNSNLHNFEVFEPSKESSSKPSASALPLSLSKPAVIPEPVFIQKFPSVSVLGGGGRSIGSRLANHSLGSSKTNKSRLHKHHHHHRNAIPSNNVVTEDDFSDFQQASASDLFPRCQPTSKPPAMHTFLLKESAIRDENPAIVEPSPSKPEIFVETSNTVPVVEKIPQVSKPPSSSLPRAAQLETGGELMGTEDRYGALRALSFATDAPEDSTDDFGDFFSSQPAAANDSFAEIAARVSDPVVADTFAWGPTEPDKPPEQVEFQVDDWSSFASATPTHSDANSLTQSHSSTYLPSDANGRDAATSEPITHQIGLGLDLDFGLGPLVKPLPSVVPSSLSACDDIKGLSFDLMDSTDICVTAPLSDVFVGEHETEEDDFGDFVGPEIVLEVASSTSVEGEIDLRQDGNVEAGPRLDERNEEASKDVGKMYNGAVAENHLVTGLWLEEAKAADTQSVSSLELPGLEQAWDAVGEWRKCLRSCVTVLQAAADTLLAVQDPVVMAEVLAAGRTREHLRDIVEVWAVTERLAASYRQSGADSRIDALLSSVETAWQLLKPLLSQAHIPLEPETTTEGHELCGVCLVGGAKLVFDNRSYHASCANLWLNKVDSVLPALQLP